VLYSRLKCAQTPPLLSIAIFCVRFVVVVVVAAAAALLVLLLLLLLLLSSWCFGDAYCWVFLGVIHE
jgi:hypothetical protein